MNIREQALAALGGPSRENFLNALAGGLAMSGRSEYVEAGNDEAHALNATCPQRDDDHRHDTDDHLAGGKPCLPR
jgi:hypothetical protein